MQDLDAGGGAGHPRACRLSSRLSVCLSLIVLPQDVTVFLIKVACALLGSSGKSRFGVGATPQACSVLTVLVRGGKEGASLRWIRDCVLKAGSPKVSSTVEGDDNLTPEQQIPFCLLRECELSGRGELPSRLCRPAPCWSLRSLAVHRVEPRQTRIR